LRNRIVVILWIPGEVLVLGAVELYSKSEFLVVNYQNQDSVHQLGLFICDSVASAVELLTIVIIQKVAYGEGGHLQRRYPVMRY
jgi:hypothetical protein